MPLRCHVVPELNFILLPEGILLGSRSMIQGQGLPWAFREFRDWGKHFPVPQSCQDPGHPMALLACLLTMGYRHSLPQEQDRWGECEKAGVCDDGAQTGQCELDTAKPVGKNPRFPEPCCLNRKTLSDQSLGPPQHLVLKPGVLARGHNTAVATEHLAMGSEAWWRGLGFLNHCGCPHLHPLPQAEPGQGHGSWTRSPRVLVSTHSHSPWDPLQSQGPRALCLMPESGKGVGVHKVVTSPRSRDISPKTCRPWGPTIACVILDGFRRHSDSKH